MSVKQWGRLTPLQGCILGLIGYTVSRQGVALPAYMDGRMENIRRARQRLIQWTGRDFGYDVRAWHAFLSEDRSDEYTQTSAYAQIHQAIAATQKDRDLLQIVDHLERCEREMPHAESRRLRGKAGRRIEKHNQPNPPGLMPPVRTDEGLVELWRWAVWWDLEGVLAGLALPICSLADELHGKADLKAHFLVLADRAREKGDKLAYARFLTAAGKLEPDKQAQFDLVQQALTAHREAGNWGGQAYCAHQLANLHRYRRQFEEQERLHLQAFKLWERHDHARGMGISLIHLAENLIREGQFEAACQFYFCAKKLLRYHITYITARDLLTRVSHDHQVVPEAYTTGKSPSALVRSYFRDRPGFRQDDLSDESQRV